VIVPDRAEGGILTSQGATNKLTFPRPIRRTCATLGGVVCAFATLSSPALADNSLNSSEKAPPVSRATEAPRAHTDFTIVPVVGGSTDIGVGGGFFSGLTRNKIGQDPYVWNLEAAAFVSFGLTNGGVNLPYIDGYSKLTITRFAGSPHQIEIRPSFTDEETLYYFGMGNASAARPPAGESLTYFRYARIHPSVVADLILKIVDHWAARTGIRFTETWLHIPAHSRLASDFRDGSPEVKALIGETGTQSVLLFRQGLRFDNRDNEVTPHKGTIDEIEFKWSPGGTSAFPFRYGEASINLRWYVPLFSPRLTLAARIVGDVLFGDPPFYELSRFEDTYAVGGASGVRGVPAQRYYGKVKVFGNAEVRARLWDFSFFGKPMTLGLAAFFDGGRVWADISPQPELDGTGFGLKYGVGGGLRLMSGTAFVLRGDVAWSPDALPIGGYLAAGEIF
jgi:hypothetical protein